MKKQLILMLWLIAIAHSVKSQNWSKYDNTRKNSFGIGVGIDNSFGYSLNYSRLLNVQTPTFLITKLSIPFGVDLVDDLNYSLGGQAEIFSLSSFRIQAQVLGKIKRHETELVRMTALGTDASLITGFYRRKWHIGLNAGIQYTAFTHLKHAHVLRNLNPNITDGWLASSGALIHIKFHGGVQISQNSDLNFAIGSLTSLEKNFDPLLPATTELTWVRYF